MDGLQGEKNKQIICRTKDYYVSLFIFSNFPAIIKPSINNIIDEMPAKSKVIGLYNTRTLPKVNPIIE